MDALWASAPHSCYCSGSCPHCHAYSTLTEYALKLWFKLGASFKCFSWSLGYNREKCNSHNLREILSGKESLRSENAHNLLTIFFLMKLVRIFPATTSVTVFSPEWVLLITLKWRWFSSSAFFTSKWVMTSYCLTCWAQGCGRRGSGEITLSDIERAIL